MTSTDIIIVAVAAIIIGIIAAFIAKKSMNDAVTPSDANMYLDDSSAKITKSNDIFLYSSITRVPLQQNNNNRQR